MNWYGRLAWRIHVWVRPEHHRPRLGRRLSDWIVSIVFPIWYGQWRDGRGL